MFNIDLEGFDLEKTYDLIVLGGGPAAIGCAIYAARFAMEVLVVGKTFGGLIATTHLVENYPGITSISGQGLMEMFKDHMDSLKIPYISDEIRNIEKLDDHFVLQSFFQKFKAYSICIATGSVRKKLGIPGEDKFAGRGVSYCATCDGPFYIDKVVCVIGGSDSAAKEALLLTQWAKKVYIIYRREKIRAEPINLEKVEKNDKIEVINNTNITEIKGNDDGVTNVVLDTPYNDSNELELDAVFVEIGRVSKSEIAKNLGVELNEKGEIVTDKAAKTNIEGIYAAGDVTNAEFKQAIISSSEGVLAAYSAYEYLEKKK